MDAVGALADVVFWVIMGAAILLVLSCFAFLGYLQLLKVLAKQRKLYRPDTYRG